MCLCHVSSFHSVFMRTLTGCRNVSLSCEHFTFCVMRTLTGCRNVSLSDEHFTFCVHANTDRLQKCVSVMGSFYFVFVQT